MSHPERQRLADWDRLDEDARRPLLEHLEACAECRALWLEADPSRLFALLAQADVSHAALEALSASVSASTAASPAPGTRNAAAGWGALAASLLLALALGAALLDDALVSPDQGVVASAPHLASWEIDTLGSAEPGIQLVASPGEAQVVDLKFGETQVLMIFDEALDL